jgi:hypothetical protein
MAPMSLGGFDAAGPEMRLSVAHLSEQIVRVK